MKAKGRPDEPGIREFLNGPKINLIQVHFNSMDFYLVRHGEAKVEHEDPRRPLSERGRKQAETVVRAAAAKKIQVSEIRHSDKLRSRQTAEILAQFLTPDSGIREVTGLSPEDDPMIAKAELNAADKPLVLVGHLPHLGRLASLLISGDSERLSIDLHPATMICLSRAGETWKIKWTLTPEVT